MLERLRKNTLENNITKVILDQAWAGNTVNTVIFRGAGIMTFYNNQFTAYYKDKYTLVVIKRDRVSGKTEKSCIISDKEYNIKDAHNSISMGIDRDGYIHLSYDHHANSLNYRRSNEPYCIDSWSEPIEMNQCMEDKVTYPTFIMNYQEDEISELLFLYRNGGAGNGDAILKSYNEETQTWEMRADILLKGTEQKPWSCSPYWNYPSYNYKGELYISYTWRLKCKGDDDYVNNINIGCLKSNDYGKSWTTNKGYELDLPITMINSETVWVEGVNGNLINQTSSACDSKGNPHIVYYANDIEGIPQYKHLWFDGESWHNKIISKRTQKFDLLGRGALQIPMSRPEILIDEKDIVYVIYRADFTENKLVVQKLQGPHYEVKGKTRVLYDETVGYCEPIIDKALWAVEKKLAMLVQKNNQPAHDIHDESEYNEDIYIMEWDSLK